MKHLIVFLIANILSIKTFALKINDSIQWKSINLIDKDKTKLYFIDVYTDWCGWCKEMDRTTFKNKDLINYLNNNYNNFKFNAEQKEDIIFNSHKYAFLNDYNLNELALELSMGKPSFPLLVIVDPKKYKIFPFYGYRSAKDFEIILKFFAENKEISKEVFEEFKKKFKEEWQ